MFSSILVGSLCIFGYLNFFLYLVLFSSGIISLHKHVMDILFDFENMRGNKKCVQADAR